MMFISETVDNTEHILSWKMCTFALACSAFVFITNNEENICGLCLLLLTDLFALFETIISEGKSKTSQKETLYRWN